VSYSTIWTSVGDEALRGRITACVAQESDVGADPFALFLQVQWPVVTASDVEEAYAYALNAGNPDPGGDPAVVSDGMILSHVQATLAELEAQAPPLVNPTSRT
jgi:hypothetical protein